MYAIDIDEVLADYRLGMIQRYGRPAAEWGGLSAMWPEVSLDEHFLDRDFVLNLPVIPGAVHGVRRLQELTDICYLTARPENKRWITMRWLARNGFPLSEIHLSGGTENKWRYLLAHPIEAMIDDSPTVLAAADNLGIKPIVFDAPWNRDLDVGIRVRNWNELIWEVERGRNETERSDGPLRGRHQGEAA